MIKKKTKIVATISDLNCEVGFLKKLYEEGMNVVRLNTAHQSIEGAKKVIKNVRSVSDKIGILIDTKGPEVRTMSGKVELVEGKNVKIVTKGSESNSEKIVVSYPNFINEIPVKTRILIDDGEIELEVEDKTEDSLICKALNSGSFDGKKSLNIPGIKLDLESVTKKDKEYIQFAVEENLDFIAHSFVRNKEDLRAVQKILDKHQSNIKIIAKIENQEGVDNINEILDEAYGVMIARGDLGIEVPAEKVPAIQKKLIEKCIERKRPVIVATQMLHSMIKNPRPTRAEVTDIANAVLSHADAIMLSGETAYGKYPLEAVKVMSKIARETESSFHFSTEELPIKNLSNEVSAFLAKSAVRASVLLPLKAIIADTVTGRTVRYLSAFRSRCPIFAQCYDDQITRHLSLSYGVYATKVAHRKTSDLTEFIKKTAKNLKDEGFVTDEDLVAIVAGNFEFKEASFLEIVTINKLINEKRF
jgi:pyruvate kinase